eukprot:63035-Chlamydomonas_euryale.AAC.8
MPTARGCVQKCFSVGRPRFVARRASVMACAACTALQGRVGTPRNVETLETAAARRRSPSRPAVSGAALLLVAEGRDRPAVMPLTAELGKRGCARYAPPAQHSRCSNRQRCAGAVRLGAGVAVAVDVRSVRRCGGGAAAAASRRSRRQGVSALTLPLLHETLKLQGRPLRRWHVITCSGMTWDHVELARKARMDRRRHRV